jgi:diguanylate cyclase (GGDEF)-like protein/PAS domain S-box-containing protein
VGVFLSNSIRNLLYLGDNIALIDTLLNSFFAGEKTDNYPVFHLVSSDQLYQTLSENSFSHFISELPLNTDIKDKIKADFPLLNTNYLNADDGIKGTGVSLGIENIFTSEAQTVLESLSIPIYFKNKQAQYLACNRHFSELFGLSPDQVIGKKLADLSHSPLRNDIRQIDQKIFIDHRIALHEYRWINKAGEERDLLVHKESAADGEIQTGIIFDITDLNRSKYLLEKEHVMLRTTADISKDMISFKDSKRRLLGCNKQYEKFIGVLEKDLLGKKVDEFLLLDEGIESTELDQYVLKNNKVYVGNGYFTASNGERYFLQVKKVPLQDKHGNIQGIITVMRNITDQLLMMQRLEITNVVFENSKEALIVTDGEGYIISANDHACFIFGYNKDQLLAQEINLLAADSYNGTSYKNIEQILKTDSSWQGDITYRTKSGNVYYAWLEVYEVQHVQQNNINRIYSYTDLTYFQATDKKISFLSKQDPLTGLCNRISLFSRLEDIIKRANYQHNAVAVILVDIDNFKSINDKHGHNTGDQVLKEVAKRLIKCISGQDTLGRFANDQFIIIIDELVNEHDAAMVAQKVVEQFSCPFIIENVHTNVTARVGISLCPDDGNDVDTLFLNAQKAMQRSKRGKSDTYHFYTHGLTLGLSEQLSLEEELKQALLLDQFDLYYQPQYDRNKRQMVALESLLRWHHPKRGILLPERFLSVAEESNLLAPIGREMIRKAALQAVAWGKANIKFGRIAVNLSKIQLSQIRFIADLQTILKETGCSTAQLEFFVDKTILRENSIDILSNLENVHKMGIALTVTNFGMAINVIDLINRLGVANLKISDSKNNNGSGSLVDDAQLKSVNVFARTLGLGVVSDWLDNGNQEEISAFHQFKSGRANIIKKKGMSTAETTFYLSCNNSKRIK